MTGTRVGKMKTDGMGATSGAGDRWLALAEYAERLLATRQDPRGWMEANLWIRTKDRRVIPFLFNAVQVDYYGRRSRRDIILKPRQQGFTTLICALFFADCLLRPNTTSAIVAHDIDSAEKYFLIIQLFWERLDAAARALAGKPRFSNRREFLWPKINSHFYVGTAGAMTFGRGQTINNLHCSEFAFWREPDKSLTALTEAVPTGGRIVIESTANGVGNQFHDLWVEAKGPNGRYAPRFYRWWQDPAYALALDAGEEKTLREQLTEKERQLIVDYRLGLEQIKWRRDKVRELRDRFPQEYPEEDVGCFLAAGRGVFERDRLMAAAGRIAAAPAPLRVQVLRAKERRVPIAPAELLVWQRPVVGKTYVIGADVGEGLANGDASCGCVLDRETGAQVAELHGRLSPERFAQQLDLLGRLYNTALLAVERNNHGHSTLNTLRNVCRYPRLYYHVRYDHMQKTQPVLGWPTDQATKPILVDDLAAAIAQDAIIINSSGLVGECLTFVTTDTGAQEAAENKYDDRVIAAGIAWQIRKRAAPRPIAKRPAGW